MCCRRNLRLKTDSWDLVRIKYQKYWLTRNNISIGIPLGIIPKSMPDPPSMTIWSRPPRVRGWLTNEMIYFHSLYGLKRKTVTSYYYQGLHCSVTPIPWFILLRISVLHNPEILVRMKCIERFPLRRQSPGYYVTGGERPKAIAATGNRCMILYLGHKWLTYPPYTLSCRGSLRNPIPSNLILCSVFHALTYSNQINFSLHVRKGNRRLFASNTYSLASSCRSGYGT